jgi:uncharacterized protein (UPF0276 family)
VRAGIGLRALHHEQVIAHRPPVAWFEAHSENYFARGGTQPRYLRAIREHYPVALHGVGLGIGSTDPLDEKHIAQLQRLVRDVDPLFVSEHLSWSSLGGRHTNDLLPLPYTAESLALVTRRVRELQERLERRILVENVSSYLEFADSEISEWDFLAELARSAGCGILLDVNNIFVNARNHGFDPLLYLDAMPAQSVEEIHLAGHSVRDVGGRELRIDTHDSLVCDEVWALYAAALRRLGPVPTLIEWDVDVPAIDVLLAEARRADLIAGELHARVA